MTASTKTGYAVPQRPPKASQRKRGGSSEAEEATSSIGAASAIEGEQTASEEHQVRPKTIVYFELISIGTLVFNTLRSYLDWDRILRPAPFESLLVRYYFPLTIIIGSFVLFGVLTLLVSRRRSKIAMWVSIAAFFISFAFLVLDFFTDVIHARLVSENMIRALEHISQGVAFGLLFTPSARRWMNREDQKAA